MKKLIHYIFVSLLLVVTGQSVIAAQPVGSVSMSTGGSGRGTNEPVDSVMLNPAAVGVLPSKFMTVNYQQKRWGLALADNGDDALFPAALTFSKETNEPYSTQQLGLVLNYAYKSLISVGAAVNMVEYDPGNSMTEKKYRQTVADVGLMWVPNKNFSFGLVANKVGSTTIDLDPALQKQKTVGIGGQYTYLNFARFRFDIESAPDNKTDRLVYMGGFESFINDWVVARLGYQNNNVLARNYTTMGLGFSGPQFGIHYGFQMDPENRTNDVHSFDLGVPF